MVINTYYKFIFIHIPKAAGTSAAMSLKKVRGNHKRWRADAKHETLRQWRRNLPARRSTADRLLRRSVTGYFKFGFVRNPWDRMSSVYRYLIEKRPRQEIDSVDSFKDFLIQADQGIQWINQLQSMRSQLDYFTLPDDTLKLDFLGHFEHLEADFSTVTQRLGCNVTLPHVNRSSNTYRDYRTQYDQDMIALVTRRFNEEIDHFGYTFEQSEPKNRCSGPLNCER